MTRPPSPSGRSLRPSRPKSRLISEQYRTSSGRTKQLKSNSTLTLTTPRNFSARWKPFLAPLPRAEPHYCRQTGRRSSRTKEGLSKRWREHFGTLLNRPSSVDSDTQNQISQHPARVSLAKPNTIEVIHPTISGRASGKDGIPADIYKAAGPDALGALHDVLLTVWEEEMMPDDFRDALIVSLYKKKGSKSDCDISLLSVAGKIFARVILNRLITVSEQTLSEPQCGFRPGGNTVDMIFAVRQLQGKCFEQNKPLYSVFIDLTKAFDTVNRKALWTVLECIGCPPKLVSMIRLFHDGMTS